MKSNHAKGCWNGWVIMQNLELYRMNEGRLHGVSQERVKKMEETLSETFALWPCTEKLIKNTEDLRLLESMKTDRAATFGSHDKLLASKIERHQKRLRLEDLHCEKHSAINELNTLGRLAESDSDSDESDGYSENESAASVPFCKTPRAVIIVRPGLEH